jgi:hypothetical protein
MIGSVRIPGESFEIPGRCDLEGCNGNMRFPTPKTFPRQALAMICCERPIFPAGLMGDTLLILVSWSIKIGGTS